MGHTGGKQHHPLAIPGSLDHLGNDARRGTVARNHSIEFLLPEEPARGRRECREVVALHRRVHPHRLGQVALLDHQPQRLLEDTLLEEAIGLTAHHAVMVAVVDEALAEAIGRRRQPQHLEPGVGGAQPLDHPTVAGILRR